MAKRVQTTLKTKGEHTKYELLIELKLCSYFIYNKIALISYFTNEI